MTWPLHSVTWHDTVAHPTLLHLTPQATLWHQNRSHYHRGTAENSFTAKKWSGHGAGRSPCAHSMGKFFLCYIPFFFFWNFRPRLARELLVYPCIITYLHIRRTYIKYTCRSKTIRILRVQTQKLQVRGHFHIRLRVSDENPGFYMTPRFTRKNDKNRTYTDI